MSQGKPPEGSWKTGHTGDLPAPPSVYRNMAGGRDHVGLDYQYAQLVLLDRLVHVVERLVHAVEGDGEGEPSSETTGSPESPAPASESEEDLSEIAPSVRSKLADVGFPLAELDVSYMPEQSAVRIHTKDGFDVTDEWREWTAERFGKGKPGDILWGTYEKEDGSEGYYPKAYDIPLHAVPEVLEDG